MIQRSKRSWSSFETQEAVSVINAARGRLSSLMGKAPIYSEEYRALSALMADLRRTALVFGHDVTAPEPTKSLSKPRP